MNLERGRTLSWTKELYQIYENNCGKEDEKVTFLPLSHSTANAQIEVTVSETGDFITSARLEDKSDSVTIIPVTEDSGSRGAGNNPHPFADKLLYLAGDYNRYVADAKEKDREYYKAYIDQLMDWSNSEYTHPAVKAVAEYLKKETLIRDLVESHSLILDEQTEKLKKNEKILGIDQKDAFVRFRIRYADLIAESKTWKDSSLYESYYGYNQKLLKNIQLCYATGNRSPCTYKHPSKIRNAGDKAKLISTNDESGFTYRGRFASKEQAISVSYDFSQKMHNALKWLIAKQGVNVGTMELLIWASNLQPLPDVLGKLYDEDAWEDNWDAEEGKEENQLQADTMPIFKSKIQKAIWGSSGGKAVCDGMDPNLKAMVMVLDAATTGRLSMNLYEELQLTDFYENLEKWHCNTAWIRFDGKKRKNELNSFSLYEIADFAYGTEQDKFIKCKPELRSRILLRLLPCVINGKNVPSDIVTNLFQKACAPTAYGEKYNWRKVLEAACGLIRKKIIEEKGEYQVALDKTCRERDYLYGRLLAIAEVAEASTYKSSKRDGKKEETETTVYATKDDARMTNASKFFEAFSNRPYQTWEVIRLRLEPYLKKMEMGNRIYYEKIFAEVTDLFEMKDFMNNSKLKPIFLLAYYCQLNELYKGKNNANDNSEEENK